MMMICQNKKKVKATTTSCVSFHLKQRIFIEVLTNAQGLKWEMKVTRSGGVYAWCKVGEWRLSQIISLSGKQNFY
jgi:hypothetical protein